jgi:CubicO group peptidase (beta-lactamase class C family)
MKRLIIYLVSALLSLSLIAQNPNPSAAIDSQIENMMDNLRVPGLSTVVVKDGEIVWINSYGYANTDLAKPYTNQTSQMLASVSKIFTGIAVMQLVDEGLISLDDEINNYLPFQVYIPNFTSVAITFRMLLTHTSSIRDGNAMDNYYNYNGDPTIMLADCMERYFSVTGSDYHPTGNFLNAQPGTVYEYSNMATALSGYLVEVIKGMPFNEYCNENIFNRLCMDNTRWFLSEFQNLDDLASPHEFFTSQYHTIDHYGFADYPNGLLRSNVTDLANMMITLLQEGSFNNEMFIDSGVLSQMFTHQVAILDPYQGLQFYSENFNTSSGNVTMWGHNGGELGIGTDLFLDLENNIGIAVLGNGDNDVTSIIPILYDYGITLTTSGVGNPDCVVTTSSVELSDNSSSVSIYPNPASDFVMIEAELEANRTQEVIIFDLVGKQVLSIHKLEVNMLVDVSSLSAGIYIYTLKENNKPSISGKLVVSK